MTDPRFPQPYQPPRFPPGPPEPNAVTAIFAAILAILGGLRGVFGAVAIPFLNTDSDFDPSGFWSKIQVLLGVSALCSLVLLVGGILMLARKKIARVLIGVGGTGTLALSVITSIALYNHLDARADDSTSITVSFDSDLSVFNAIGFLFNIALLVLTFLPSTGRWLAHHRPAY
ncbi:hypothetical protein ACFU44_21185 [Nocardia rhizosphaerihabitans]|uniref:hypothetical protein n=1 Tax=Nocardia rhizosphaerihabitans TaxID=1691570 RepID=UPI00366D37FE